MRLFERSITDLRVVEEPPGMLLGAADRSVTFPRPQAVIETSKLALADLCKLFERQRGRGFFLDRILGPNLMSKLVTVMQGRSQR